MSFLDDLRATFADRTAHTAVEWRGRAYSYGELERLALAAGALLRDRGMGPGERVAVWTADRFAFLVAHLGVLFGGGVSLPLNPRFTREEMRHFLADSGAAVVVGDPDGLPLLDELRPSLPDLRSVVTADEVAAAPHRPARARPDRARRPVPDPLQFRHDRPAEGRGPHARQPRGQPARAARLLAGHPRRRRAPRPAAVPHPRPVVRRPADPARRRAVAAGGRLPPGPHARGGRAGDGLHGRADDLLPPAGPPRVPRRRPANCPACGCSPAARPRSGPRCCPCWKRSSAGRSSTATA